MVRTGRRLLALGAVVLAACGSGTPAPSSSAAGSPSPATSFAESLRPVPNIPAAGSAPRTGVPWYLAVGDSITFGYSIDPARWNGVNSSWALQLQPLLAASGRPWQLYDLACPGETTASYQSLCSQRALVPALRTRSQHDAALAAIRAHGADLRLVLVDLGSNDLLHALRGGQDPATATAALRTALGAILHELAAAAPGVPMVVANFYDPFANLEPATAEQVAGVNAVVAELAGEVHARVADFFGAVNTVIPPPDPHLCTYVDCAHGDIHPTVAGQQRLARAALAALSG